MRTSYRIIDEGGIFECQFSSLGEAIAVFRWGHPQSQIKEIWLTSASGKWLQIPPCRYRGQVKASKIDMIINETRSTTGFPGESQ